MLADIVFAAWVAIGVAGFGAFLHEGWLWLHLRRRPTHAAAERPMTNRERISAWYAKAALVDGYLMTGPLDEIRNEWRAREYARSAHWNPALDD
jgi:hypothetical protein